jgi:hypothetical protein
MPVSQAPRKKQATRQNNAKKAATKAEMLTVSKHYKTPLYVLVATFAFIIVGIAVVILNFLDVLPGDMQQQYSFIGIIFLSFGLVTATQIK